VIPLEIDEQQKLIQYLTLKKLPYAAIPNGTNIKSKQGRTKAKKEGLQKGFPDMVVFLKDSILFVEMKRVKNSTTSPDQIKWNEIINQYSYANAIISKGAGEAIEYIERYNR
jgi:hypothetical protein